MSEAELKPCPFCGAAAEIDDLQPYWNYRDGTPGTRTAIYCTSCDAGMGYCHEDHPGDDLDELNAELFASWNRRTPQAEQRGRG